MYDPLLIFYLLDSAATTGQIPRALTLLSKRRNKPAEVIRIMQILQSKSPIPFAVEALPNNA